MKFNSLIPELYVSNFSKSLNFYTNLLGFKLEYQRPKPLFAFLSYEGSQLMIQQEDENEVWHNGKPEYPFGRGLNFQIESIKIIDSFAKSDYPLC
jgi:lactoylglutathione lyase